MEDSKIMEIIEKYCETKDERKYLKCTDAFKVAEELNLGVSKIGNLCSRHQIKIKGCQLGCF